MITKILLVNILHSEENFLKHHLREYTTLSTGCHPMDLFKTNEGIKLIILDLDNNTKECLEFLHQLSLENYYNNIPIFILNPQDEDLEGLSALKLTTIVPIKKPIQIELLKTCVRNHIELYELRELSKYLEHKNQVFEMVFNHSPIGIGVFKYKGLNIVKSQFNIVNETFIDILGRPLEELMELGWTKSTHPEDIKKEEKFFNQLHKGEIKNYSLEKRYIRPDGSVVWAYKTAAEITIGEEVLYLSLIQDITSEKNIQFSLLESERSKSVYLSHLPGLAYRCRNDKDWTMLFVSSGCLELTGYPSESLLYNKDLTFNDLIALEYREEIWDKWDEILEKKETFEYEYELITARGERKWVLELGQGVINKEGKIKVLEGIVLDISDRKLVEENLRHKSEHDDWTGLYNRNYLEKLLLEDAKANTNEKRALINVNLSSIQKLIMTYGFHYSQDLIKKIGKALNTHTNRNILLFKTFENRFVFYIKGYKNREELIGFSTDLIKTLEPILTIERVTGGLGIIELDNSLDIDNMLKKLLIASERAINGDYHGNFGIKFYDVNMEKEILREDKIHLILDRAIKKDERFYLQFQPIINLKTNKIGGFEALARLESGQLGHISPLEFIPIAERTKLIIPLGELIFLQAFRFLRKVQGLGYKDINISINISGIQLLREDFIKTILKHVEDIGIKAENITLEITESIYMSKYQELNIIIENLRRIGFSIAIDDFGTGYSSFSRGSELKVDCIKIDKFFLDRFQIVGPDKSIIGDIISMCHRLGSEVVAEGVEYENQRKYIESQSCDKFQGYFFSKPLDEDEAIRLLKKNHIT